jgi:DNA-binding MarR family transcriptional regulator
MLGGLRFAWFLLLTGGAKGMTDNTLSPTDRKVLDFLWQNHGLPYAVSDVCEVADCSTGQAQVALDVLASAGLIERQQGTVGAETYVARSGESRS